MLLGQFGKKSGRGSHAHADELIARGYSRVDGQGQHNGDHRRQGRHGDYDNGLSVSDCIDEAENPHSIRI